MGYKVKEQYKGHHPVNFNLPLDKLSQKQIEGLLESHRELYFEATSKHTKKDGKALKPKKIEDL